MPSFSNKSKERLLTCDQRLQAIFMDAVGIHDCTILEGHRSSERQAKLYAAGQSKVEYSRHNRLPSYAVDVAPWPLPNNWGEDHEKEKAKFYYFAGIIKAVAARYGYKVRWGGDWDGDNDFKDQTFDDLVHFEIED